jgi:lipopolysaccharide transport system ATP-binding protein
MSSDDDVAIEVSRAGKTYRLYARPADRLKQALFGGRPRYTEFTALSDADFTLRRGEAMGIVGVNGAGKSTLLQLIAGTLRPTQGSVRTRGRIAALLELGSGFNPEFTGRENVFLNAATLGLEKREIDRRLDSIVEFSGIGAHIDQPVKTYSSGMYVRLAFSIATSVDPDILVVDEALSVGDGAFARRSFDRIMQIRDRGATVLFCSHALFHVEMFCDRALWLHEGRVREIGRVSQVLGRYQEFLDGLTEGLEHPGIAIGEPPVAAAPAADAAGAVVDAGPAATEGAAGEAQAAASAAAGPGADAEPGAPSALPAGTRGAARIVAVRVYLDDRQGDELYGDSGRSTLRVEIDFASDPAMPAPSAALVLSSEGGRILSTHATRDVGVELARDAQGDGNAAVVLERIPLNKGRYRVGAYLLCERGMHVYQWIDPVAHLSLHGERFLPGYFLVDARWGSGGAAGHWDRWQSQREAAHHAMSDWGDHPEVLRLVFGEAFGGEAPGLLEWLKRRFGPLQGRALSLCCGDGAFERSLVAHGVFAAVDGIDLSPARIESARAAAGEYADRLGYRVGNVDDARFGEAQYDFVVAKASLHHVSNLEGVFEAIARCLRPGGRLVTLDFFGPTRFQWTDRQLAEVNRFLDDEVPPQLRLRGDGSTYRAVRPGVDEMIAMDPSEAVRAGEVYAQLRARFEPEVDLPLGGAMLNLVLHGDVVNNFDPANDAHNALIRRAFARERELMRSGEIGSDFRLIVARPR